MLRMLAILLAVILAIPCAVGFILLTYLRMALMPLNALLDWTLRKMWGDDDWPNGGAGAWCLI